jgi:diacylglycerol O-acyltransferase / wax synthase
VLHAFKLIAPTPPPLTQSRSEPGALRRALGVVIGLAQLATDGRARGTLPSGSTGSRRFAMVGLPLATVRAVARGHRVRVSDVLLSAVAGAVQRVCGGDGLPPMLRVAVTLTVRVPDTTAEGNSTAAVMTDVPLGPMPEPERLAETARRSGPLHTGTRALASRFVMETGTAVLPPPAQAWFARTVYGRRYFHGIVSNMPGPPGVYRMAGGLMTGVYPILPLAPGAPLAVGVLGWDATLCVGVSVDPELVDDAADIASAVRQIIDDLEAAMPVVHPLESAAGDVHSVGAGSSASPRTPTGHTG